MRVSAGVSYRRQVQLFRWDGTYISDANGDYVSDALSPSVAANGDLFFTREREIVKYNKHNQIHLPVHISYELSHGRIETRIFGSLRFSLLESRQGYVLGQDRVPVPIERAGVKAGIGYGGGVDISYDLSQKWGLVSRLGYVQMPFRDDLVEWQEGVPELSVGVFTRL